MDIKITAGVSSLAVILIEKEILLHMFKQPVSKSH